MPGIDERLQRDLERGGGAAPDPGAQLDDVTRRRARRSVMRRVQTVALVTVVLAGTAAGFVTLQRNFSGATQPGSSGSSAPSPSTTSPSESAGPTPSFDPIAIPEDPTKVFSVDGLSFPVCRGSVITGDFLGTGPTYAYVFTKASDAGCLPGEGTSVVAVQVPSDAAGAAAGLVVGGPLDCQVDPPVCAVFANPDIDGDGRDEIAIITKGTSNAVLPDVPPSTLELYQANHTSNGWGLVPLIDADGFPAAFLYGGSTDTQLAGAYCDDSSGQRRFVAWVATSSDGSTYDVSETIYVLNGEGLLALAPHHLTSPADSLPPADLGTCSGPTPA